MAIASPIREEQPLVLGSASPRRTELLTQLRLPHRVLPADVDESVWPAESAQAYLERIAQVKLEAVSRRLVAEDWALWRSWFIQAAEPRVVVLVADTSVILEQEILGKPADTGEAFEMLSRLIGREHEVMTRYAIGVVRQAGRERSTAPQLLAARTVQSRVRFRHCSEEMLRRYAESKEGLDKAGAYAVQGIGSFLIEAIDGSYSNVVGLPICEVVLDLERLGLLLNFPG